MQPSRSHDLQQQRHQHLHQTPTQPYNNHIRKQQDPLHDYLNAQLILDTPSTTHAVSSHHFTIKSIAQKNKAIEPKFNQELIKTEQKYERINSKILSVREIKDQQAKQRQRASSRASVQSKSSRKLFVSIARSNTRLSEERGIAYKQLGRGEQLQSSGRGRQQSSKKIKLTKYMQLRIGEKVALR